MSYIGNQPPDIGAYEVQSFDGGGTEFTLQRAATTPSVLLFIDGVRQTPTDAYSVSGVTLTTTATTPSGTANVTVMFMGDVVDIGAPSDDTVSTAKIQDDAVTTAKINDDAVTAAKLANSINTEIAANTAKVTNATHTGDVTGATALTIANDAVDIAMLSATGTASATTYLRGDNAWSAIAGGLSESSQWRLTTDFTGDATITANLEVVDTDGYGSLGSAMTESSGVFTFPSTGIWLINACGVWEYNYDTRAKMYIDTTTDDGTYAPAAYGANHMNPNTTAWTECYVNVMFQFDVTDVSTHKVRFRSAVANASTVTCGNSGISETSFTFTKLGDT